MNHIVSIKALRHDVAKYAARVAKGESFIVVKRSKPIFQINPLDETWEEVIDFTKIKRGGVKIEDILARL